jgi:hypothetical protein
LLELQNTYRKVDRFWFLEREVVEFGKLCHKYGTLMLLDTYKREAAPLPHITTQMPLLTRLPSNFRSLRSRSGLPYPALQHAPREGTLGLWNPDSSDFLDKRLDQSLALN